ncbi:MAG TPA: anthranilate synthase component I family protein [Polyangiaceae bacterium]|nr:anthranilate synthase component I family protein [Polyangiaceae bacterium]
MPLSALVVDIKADPVAVALRLAGRPGFAFLHAAPGTSARPSFLAVDPVESCTDLLPVEPLLPALAARDTRAAVPRWMGAVPYECARQVERPAWTRRPDERPAPHLVLPVWRRYGAVVEIDPARGLVRVVGDDVARVTSLGRELSAALPSSRLPFRLEPLDDDPPQAHMERVRRAQELIARGHLYQVNLARRQRFSIEGRVLDGYLALADEAPAPFGACIALGEGGAMCASSPELFLGIDAQSNLVTVPIKGTRPRGRDAIEDAKLARELEQSVKEHAELTMILDVERNDLGRVAVPGSVRLTRGPAVQAHRTIHHRSAVIAARLLPAKRPIDAVRAMFPSGSVTGAPKVRAMEVIAELEPARRGLYTGAFGSVAHDGSVTLAMAIRVLSMRDREAHYFAGGGIVADSDPEAELAETGWKGTQLERLVTPRAP